MQCLRAVVTPLAVLRAGGVHALSRVDVHAAMLFGCICSLTAGTQSTERVVDRGWGLRVFQACVCSALFCLLVTTPVVDGALYVSLLYTWGSGLPPPWGVRNWHVCVQLAQCTVWAEVLCAGVQRCRWVWQPRAVILAMVGAVLLALNLLLSPQLILAVALHPLYRGLEAAGGMVAVALRAEERAPSREVVTLLSQFACCLYAISFVFVHAEFVPFTEYVIAYAGGAITVKSVDILFGVYYSLMLPVIFVQVTPANDAWTSLQSTLLHLDTLFVPLMIVGVPVYNLLLDNFVAVWQLAPAPAQMASLTTAYIVSAVLTTILDDVFCRACRAFYEWRTVAVEEYEIQRLNETDSMDSGTI